MINRTNNRLRFIAIIAVLFGAKAACASVGASTPFTSYEAEAGTLGSGAAVASLTAPPIGQYSSKTLEASGHAYVALTSTGQYVQWTNNTGQNITAIDLRACVPDTPTGGGTTYNLSLYVNGVFRQTLTLSSKQTWIYEGNNNYQGNDQNPSDGDPRVFFDDMHTFVTGSPIAPGSTFRVQVDSGDTAPEYDIDVIDVEQPPVPYTQPSGSLSITDYGAVANNPGIDNTTAIQNCINACQSQSKTMWIPQGAFYVSSQGGLSANGITITGAGPWYSVIYRNMPIPFNGGWLAAIWNLTSCHVSNFANDSNAISRAISDGCGGAMDTTGTNWSANNIWTQHTMSGFWASGTGGTISNCRLTSIWADGANINNVSLSNFIGNNITEQNNFVRGTGDDGIAINSVHDNGDGTNYPPMQNCQFLNNTVECSWGGKCIAIYGGGGHLVQNNYAADTARYIALGIGKFGVNGSDLTSATVTGNMILRGGGNGFSQGQPCMHIGNGGDGQSVGLVENVTVSNNTISDALYDGVGFSTSYNINFQNNIINSPWRNGIVIQPPFYPAPTGSVTIQGNWVIGLAGGMQPFINNSSGYSASVSSNNWNNAAIGPFSPFLLDTSFESGNPQPTWNDTPDLDYWSSSNNPLNITGYLSGINPECSVRAGEQAHTGSSALMYSGSATGASADYCYYKVLNLTSNPITIGPNTGLSYWIYPQQDNGRYVGIDFHCTDGTTLRDSGSIDQNGNNMHPNAGHGGSIPLNAWSLVACNLGVQMNGKVIDRIWVAYDHPNSTGQYRGYIDDILITNGALPTSQLTSGQYLNPGKSIWSPSHTYQIDMQTDGNLVLYKQSTGVALWSSGTSGNPGAYAIMQTDGNLVVYKAGGGPGNGALWASGTSGNSGAYAAIQDDGNFVIYPSGGGSALWASGTSGL